MKRMVSHCRADQRSTAEKRLLILLIDWLRGKIATPDSAHEQASTMMRKLVAHGLAFEEAPEAGFEPASQP